VATPYHEVNLNRPFDRNSMLLRNGQDRIICCRMTARMLFQYQIMPKTWRHLFRAPVNPGSFQTVVFLQQMLSATSKRQQKKAFGYPAYQSPTAA
jgi:hypothetical protein